ncbi:hypothetical protein DICVIV_03111 [Dictyocaulus viviparus]|uniref:Uncharacterized protein n=1 Tax=Dictyocaulus viviparus TaxID=29172 RepID=A0A0D8Y452_DICVI|nr:hypothetical protein DICVIV_03111 [Dictyocaulus viviparus]
MHESAIDVSSTQDSQRKNTVFLRRQYSSKAQNMTIILTLSHDNIVVGLIAFGCRSAVNKSSAE